MHKSILIIGASSGLGRELARLYAREGCTVGAVGRRESLLQELQNEFPGKISSLVADINSSSIGADLLRFIDGMGGIDTFIITASIVEFNEPLDLEPESRTISTNVEAYTRLLNLAWQYFNKKGGGHIVGVTSTAAARGNKMAPAYHASKAFQSSYLEGLRVKSKHVKNKTYITELVPGYMDTAMGKGDRLFWVATVQKAALQSKSAIEKRKSKAFITKRWWWVYQFQRLLPTFIYDSLVNGSWKLKQNSKTTQD